MQKSKQISFGRAIMNNKQPLIDIPLPEAVFDAPDAVAQRRRRVSVETVHAVRRMARVGDPKLYETLADIYPSWAGVLDVESGAALPNPQDDVNAFKRLDYTEQVAWLLEDGLAFSPNRMGKGK